MKEKLYMLLIVVALLGLVGWRAHAQVQRPNPVRQMWEYHVEAIPGRTPPETIFDEGAFRANAQVDERLLNQRAAEGWELASTGVNYYIFRRAK